jgi:O-antigen biosynthesis protein
MSKKDMSTSIIASMYNRKQSTIDTIDKLFFPSLLQNASSNKELILLDDKSPMIQETQLMVDKYLPELKKKFGNVEYGINNKNLGFGGSYNKGIEQANGELILVVNDDVYFPNESIDSLTKTLDEDQTYGLVGPITNEKTSFTYQYAKQAPQLQTYSAEEFEKIELFAKQMKNLFSGERIETDLITGFCFATKKEILDELGAFDPEFKYGTYEDTDLAKRIGQHYKIIINPEVHIHHGGINGCSGSIKQQPLKLLYNGFRNQIEYGKRWGHINATKHMIKGFQRMKGKYTISEEIEKREN